jgi:hypothetical protein
MAQALYVVLGLGLALASSAMGISVLGNTRAVGNLVAELADGHPVRGHELPKDE